MRRLIKAFPFWLLAGAVMVMTWTVAVAFILLAINFTLTNQSAPEDMVAAITRISEAQEEFNAQHGYYAPDLPNLAQAQGSELLALMTVADLELVGSSDGYTLTATDNGRSFTLVASPKGVHGYCDAAAGCSSGSWEPDVVTPAEKPKDIH